MISCELQQFFSSPTFNFILCIFLYYLSYLYLLFILFEWILLTFRSATLCYCVKPFSLLSRGRVVCLKTKANVDTAFLSSKLVYLRKENKQFAWLLSFFKRNIEIFQNIVLFRKYYIFHSAFLVLISSAKVRPLTIEN